jgi:putative spermidine/putrescine transport system ATP-binding protein
MQGRHVLDFGSGQSVPSTGMADRHTSVVEPSLGEPDAAAAPVAGAPALALRGVGKDYDGQTVVDDFDLEVADGEFVTLLGSSGSGKTTTLMMVAGFVSPTRGAVEVAGRDMTRVSPQKRNIGMMFQSYALFPHMTVRDNVAFPLKRRRMASGDIATTVDEALRRVHLEGFADRFPAQLSGGQQQRVALARATVYSPPLLLMDEPLSALDHNLRRRLQDELKRFHRELRTSILYVTHDQDEALALSDRIAVMNDGKVVQIGSPRDIYERPTSLYVARFIGESNCLKGTVAAHEGDTTIVRVGNGVAVGGTSPQPLPVGADVVVTVRPEHLCVAGEHEQRDGAVEMRVAESSYLGGKVRCRGTFATAEPCVLELTPETASSLWANAGGRVYWDSKRAVILPDAEVPATAGA